MTAKDRCADIRPSLPELAIGSLTGHERALALQHVAGCSVCRRELQALSEVGDELLLLVPEREPPVGFESRVVDRLVAEPGEGSWSGARFVAAVALVAALVGGSVVYVTTREDRSVADRYRSTLDVADGRYFAARSIEDADGAVVGHVFGYAGSPSWVFCVVEKAGHELYEIRVSSADGREWTLGEMETRDGSGTWGRPLPLDLHEVARLEFVDRASGGKLVSDWSAE